MRPTTSAPAARHSGGASSKAASAVSGARIATATASPSKPWTRPIPRPLSGRRRSSAGRAGSPGAGAASRRRGRGGRRSAGAGTCRGRSRCRGSRSGLRRRTAARRRRGRRAATGRPAPQRLPAPLEPRPTGRATAATVSDRDGERRDGAVARQAHGPPADRAEQRQPDRGREPRPAPRAAEGDRRLADRQRRAADGEGGRVGPDHVAASLDCGHGVRPAGDGICCGPGTWPTRATRSRSGSRTWPAPPASRAPTSAASSSAPSASPRAPTC